ncbi:hypothetical protein K1T71_009929 [Dendrolimus kikuchii]|uniref:Uncharacterized protein n=1 Tax=Dendrolimus kikuchii TaxID=765133 RepID=A0ACC1CTA1_9NEOP|nr:hypothetical protein K1T71_009929 [Dendrolimus kikuchii]
MRKSLLFLIAVINCALIKSSMLSIIDNDHSRSEFSSLVKCVIKISTIELYYRPTVLIEYKNNKTVDEYHFLIEMIDQLKFNNIPQLILSDKNKINNVIEKNNATWLVVLYFDDCESLLSLNVETFKEQVYYLIIVHKFAKNVCKEVAVNIGNKVNIMMYDVTFIIEHHKEYYIASFIPEVEPDSCKILVKEPTIINTCVNGTMNLKTSFPVKTPANYNKCLFKVGMSTMYPLSIIKNKENMSTYDRIKDIKGSDFEIIKIITKQFNSTLDLYYVVKMEESPFGQLDFLPYIINGSFDALAGGFYRIYGDIVDYSGIYARQAVFWLYTADREIRSWQNFIEKLDGIYLFIIFYVVYSAIWYLVCKFDKQAVSLKNTLLYSWGALVGTSSLGDPKTIKQKILNLGYLIMCLHLSAYLSVQFYSFLTILSPPKMYNTNDDMMQSGRIPYLRSASKYFVNDEKYLNFANTSCECNNFWDCSEKSLMHKGTTVVMDSYFTHFQANTTVNDEATVLRVTENILIAYYEMLIRKGSPHVKRFQHIIQRLFEAGIPEKLYKEAIGILTFDKANIARENIMGDSYSCGAGCQITLNQIAGTFYLWLFGCGLSFAVFVIEIITHQKAVY